MQEGKRGYLEGLAAHYSKQINMPYDDVLDAIEQVRLSKWKERHVRISTGHTLSRRMAGPSCSGTGLVSSSVMPTSHSQPLYVPGKYLVSICFDFEPWLLRPQRLLRHPANQTLIHFRSLPFGLLCMLMCVLLCVHALKEIYWGLLGITLWKWQRTMG